MWNRFCAVGLGRDHWCSAALGDRCPDMVAVITPVGQEHASGWQVIIDQRIEAFEVGNLTACYFRPDREAVSAREFGGNEVDFGREATF